MTEQVPPQTITIDNFKGALTKNLFGDLNSGLSPFGAAHYGNNPFWNVYNNSMSFMSGVISTVGGSALVDPIIRAVTQGSSTGSTSDAYVYGVGINGNFYKIQATDTTNTNPDKDTITAYTNNLVASATLNYGGGITFYANNLYVGYDTGVSYIAATGNPIADAAWTPVTVGGGLTASRPRPLAQFNGNLYAGNDNNIAESTNGTSWATVSKLSPTFPQGWQVRDLAISTDGKYMIIIGSGPVKSLNDLDISSGNQKLVSTIDSAIILWNGSDAGYSSYQMVKGVNLASIAVTQKGNLVFGKDEEGIGIWDLTGQKITSLFDSTNAATGLSNATYAPYQSYVMGNKVLFIGQYGTSGFLYCYDITENNLYALWSQGYLAEFIKGSCILPSVHATNIAGTDLSRSKVYFSVSKLPVATQANNILYRMHLHNYSGDTAQNAYYSTQIQKFPKKVSIKEVRVYCAPTSANSAFNLYLVSPDSEGQYSNANFTYTYAAGTDATKGQGALDLIKYRPAIKDISSFGIQINNTGSTGMIIYKIEVDYVEALNPKTSG